MKGLESLLRKKEPGLRYQAHSLFAVEQANASKRLVAITGGGRVPAVGLEHAGRTILGFSVFAI